MRLDWSDTQLIGEMNVPTKGGVLKPMPSREVPLLWQRDDDLTVAADIRIGSSGRSLMVSIGHPSRFPTDEEIQDVEAAFFSEGTVTKFEGFRHIEGGWISRPFYIASVSEDLEDSK